MEIHFIGTASAKAEKNRFHSSFIVSSGDRKLLFDAGEGISQGLLQAGVEFNSIDAIVISHLHADHVAGLPLLITQMKIARRKKPLDIYVQKALAENLKILLSLFYVFPGKTDFRISIIPFNYDEKFKPAANIALFPRKNSHIRNKYNLPPETEIAFESAGFLITENNTRIYYTADIADKSELNLFNDKAPTHIITEAYHVSLPDIISFASSSQAEKIFVTHYASDVELQLASGIKNADLNVKLLLVKEGDKFHF